MEIHLQSDGQLYPPRHSTPPRERPKPPAKPKPEPPKEICPPPPAAPCKPVAKTGEWEDFLLIAVMFIIFRSKEQPDILLLAALAYILFDSCFSFKNLL